MFAKTLSILAATAGLSLAGAGAANAQAYENDSYTPTVPEVVVIAPGGAGEREIKSKPVYFDDLDLNSPQGGYTLLMRIRAAATQVCSPAANMHDQLGNIADYQRCVRRAVNHAVNEVGMPTVQDAYYELGVGTADLPAG